MADNKDFFDKVSDVATDVADSIAKTTSELYAKGKTQVEVARTKSDIRNGYRELGRVSYALERGHISGDDKKNEIVEKLDELHEKLNTIETQRAAEKQAKETEKASQKEAREAAKAEKAAQKEPIVVKFTSEKCAECGETRVGTLQYCGYCGTKFDKSGADEDTENKEDKEDTAE